jgi:pyridinium-3,5-biscarboxylic acid mononucleotide sulfurtransferase
MCYGIENKKYANLITFLKKLGKAAIAFSGGVDSTFLLAAAKNAIGDNVVAITVDSPALPRYELEDSIKISELLMVRHLIIKEENIDDSVKKNPVNRCYLCKKTEFGSVKNKAAELGIEYVLDGSNADDLHDFRPGMKASRETGVLSPLLKIGITKDEIRSFSKSLGLPTWDKPAYACLYSRIPYGQEIKREDLEKIEKSEKFFIDKGFKIVRVRCHGNLARIEVDPSDCTKLFSDPLRSEIAINLKSFGFDFITVDLLGYRTGSFNEQISSELRSKLI